MLRWRSVRALIFCRGMTSTSRACHTSTVADSSSSAGFSVAFGRLVTADLLVPLREADEDDAAVVAPGQDGGGTHQPLAAAQSAVRGRIELVAGGRGVGGAAPRDRHVRGPFAFGVGLGPQHHEVGRFLPPHQADVCGRRRVEHTQRRRRGIEDLHAVAGLVLGADRDREQRPLVLPRELRHVAEGRVSSRRQLADDQCGAGRRIVGRGRGKAVASSPARSGASRRGCRRR